jgi:hypothetical protein
VPRHEEALRADWHSVTFLTRIREVLGSNFGQDTSYDLGFRVPQSLQINSRTVPRLGRGGFLPNPLNSLYNLPAYYVTLYSLATDIVFKQATEHKGALGSGEIATSSINLGHQARVNDQQAISTAFRFLGKVTP